MRNNISKNQKSQFPTQVVADQNQSKNQKRSRGLKEELNRTSIEWPQEGPVDPSKFIIRVVRTKLFHTNGQVSQMIWHMPDYTAFIGCHQEAVEVMNDYIGYLASMWVGINKYHTEYGVLRADGSFKPCIVPMLAAMETIIPKGAKFKPGKKGKWILPNDLNRDLTAIDNCHCATDNDFCGDGCINTKKGGESC